MKVQHSNCQFFIGNFQLSISQFVSVLSFPHSSLCSILQLMLRLPPSIERRLMQLFPDKADREHFVARVIEDALAGKNAGSSSSAPMLPFDEQEDEGYSADEPHDEEDEEMAGGTLYLFTDGGSRGNPGEAAIGCILEDPKRGVLLKQFGECIGIETNNVAEYKALIKGLKLAQHYHPNRLICHLDSELVVRQLNGEYRVKMPSLEPLFEEAKRLSKEYPDIIFKHIPRSDNHRADALVNKVLNERARSTMPSRPMYR